MEQLKIDIMKFVDLVSKFTGISKTKLDNFLKENSVNNVFENPTALEITKPQLEKIEALRELKGLYGNLRVAESDKYVIDSSYKAGDYFKNYFTGLKDKERFVCSFLNSQNTIISTKVVFEGTINEAPIYPREIVKAALLNNACSVAFAHNHPGGSLKPSNADLNVTSRIREAMRTVSINVIDHIIVAGDSYYSFAENNKLLEDAAVYKAGSNRVLEDTNDLFSKLKTLTNNVKNFKNQDAFMKNLNEAFGKELTKNELKILCKVAGEMYEQSGDPNDLKIFNELNEATYNMKKSQQADIKEQNNEMETKPISNKEFDMEV